MTGKLPSDINDDLKEINHRLQQIVENSYLSRLDLMFSVLLSLTIFLIGLALNNTLPRSGPISVFLVSILTVLVYTLIGEFLAIIKDDLIGRFKFWVALVFGFFTIGIFSIFILATILISVSPILLLPVAYFLPLLGLLWLLLSVLFVNYMDNLFSKYAHRFQSRQISEDSRRKMFVPTLYGYLLLCISFLVAYYFLVVRV